MSRKARLSRGLYYHPKTSVVWTRFWIDGHEYRRSTRTRDPREAVGRAKQVYLDACREAATPRPDRRQGAVALLAAADIAEHEQRGLPREYIDKLESKWRVVLLALAALRDPEKWPDGVQLVTDLLHRLPSGDVSVHDFAIAYEGLRREARLHEGKKLRKARGQTIVRETGCLRRALTIAKRRGIIDVLPDDWPDIRRDDANPKLAGKRRAPEEIQAFWARLEQDARDEVVVDALTGLRGRELKRFEPGWVEKAPPGATTPYIVRVPAWAAKNRKERIIGLPQVAFDVIQRRMAANPDAKTVFPPTSFRSQRDKVSKELGLTMNITMRDLRHSYASTALEGTSDPLATMRSMGHKDLAMLERYLHSTVVRTVGASAAVAKALTFDPIALLPEHRDRSTA